MPRIIRGTKDMRTGATILKGGAGGISKIRCPSCGGQAQPATVDNKPGFACGNCGSKFKKQKM